MTTPVAASSPIVRKTVTVRASPARAFAVFTEGIDTWWPRSHHIGEGPLAETVIEPRVGGLCYGRSADGTVCPWGTVLAWEPPDRLAFAWQITGEWKYEPDLAKSSEVEVRFTRVDASQTRVDLEHRHFERHGAGADAMRTSVDSENGWGHILELFSRKAGGE
jgi:uncharacterized protein YndB with AHSA1/START domain